MRDPTPAEQAQIAFYERMGDASLPCSHGEVPHCSEEKHAAIMRGVPSWVPTPDHPDLVNARAKAMIRDGYKCRCCGKILADVKR